MTKITAFSIMAKFYIQSCIGILRSSFGLNSIFIFLMVLIGFVATVALPKGIVISVRSEIGISDKSLNR